MYVVSQDINSGMYYVHMQGFPYIPCFGTFCETMKEAKEYCKMYNGRQHRVREKNGRT